jgi:hypothetical protein
MANQYLKNAAKLNYLGVTVTNENQIHTEIESELNPQTACFHSVQFFSHLVYRSIKLKYSGV